MAEERERHRQAFELYQAAGPKRTYRVVAEKIGVAERTVRHWARTHHWPERIAEREAKVARELADRSLQEGVQEAERNLKIVRMALLKLAKDIRDGRIKGVMSDVDRLIRLEEHLSGADGSLCRDPRHVVDRARDEMDNLSLEEKKERLCELVLEALRRDAGVRRRVLEEAARFDQGDGSPAAGRLRAD